MTNSEYWLTSSTDDLDTAEKLFELGKFHHCLFFLHLSLEKMFKAVFTTRKKEPSPPIHDLVRLAEKAGVPIDDSVKLQLTEISTFNIAARYDDYKFKFYQKATKEYTKKWLQTSKTLHSWLKNSI